MTVSNHPTTAMNQKLLYSGQEYVLCITKMYTSKQEEGECLKIDLRDNSRVSGIPDFKQQSRS